VRRSATSRPLGGPRYVRSPGTPVRGAVILPPSAGRWRAVVPAGLIPGDGTATTLGAWDLCDLMNQLDEIYSDGPPNMDQI